jgi:hypothetical protein
MLLECIIAGSLLYLASVYSKQSSDSKKTSSIDMTLQPIQAQDFLMTDGKEITPSSGNWWGVANDVASKQKADRKIVGIKEGQDGQYMGDFGSSNSRFFDKVNKDI